MTAIRTVRTICLLILVACFVITVAQAVIAGDEDGGLSTAVAAAGPAAASSEAAPGADQLGFSTQALLASLTIFVLAMFEGFDVIVKVPPTLHTPLMSGSNAISGITVVGSLVAAGAEQVGLATVLGTIAVAFAMINVVGGFLVTHRMLKMFKKK
jgi:NAD(P) transhydrogenase subunit alpha